MITTSPYFQKPLSDWQSITDNLIIEHPLSTDELVGICLSSWEQMFTSSIGNLQIGANFFPQPQIIGAILHALIPANIEAIYPTKWRIEKNKKDKDVVCISDDKYSIELKTSSDKNYIFGNRSYAQPQTNPTEKNKNGYYLTINFQKFSDDSTCRPEITIIRFGWIEHTDWIAQTAATGQQARLSPDTYKYKLKTIYSR